MRRGAPSAREVMVILDRAVTQARETPREAVVTPGSPCRRSAGRRVLGADYLDVLATRDHIAAFIGQGGDCARALRLYLELLPDCVRIPGAG
jgi:hypothetical protein